MSRFSSEISQLDPARDGLRIRALSSEIATELKSIDADRSLRPGQKAKRVNELEGDVTALADLSTRAATAQARTAQFRGGASAADYAGDPNLGALGIEQKSHGSHRGGLLTSPAAVSAEGWEHMLSAVTAGQTPRIDFGNRAHQKSFLDVRTKSGAVMFDGATSGSGASVGLIQPQLLPPLEQALEVTRVADLFAHEAIDSPRWTYARHSTTTGGPQVTVEGGTKPALTFGVEVVEGQVEKLAATFTHSWELARDYESWTQQMIPSELSRVMIDAESKFLLGTAPQDYDEGASAPTADGLLGGAGLTAAVPSSDTAAGSPGLRAINKAITALRSGGAYAVADTAVMSPATFGNLRGAVDSMGRFILTEPAGDGEIPTIFGLRVCVTTAIADGTVLVCDSKQYAKVMVRDAITIMSTNQGKELMSTNSILWVVEQRIGLSIPRPAAGLVLTGVVG